MHRVGLSLGLLACTTLAASVAAPALKRRSTREQGREVARRVTWRERISNHAGFTHDSLASLGYDWGRVADPAVAPRHPLKVYLPRTTAEVARLLREARALGERPVVRSKGHSSNDLVLADRGSVLLTERLDQIIGLDQAAPTVTVQAGIALADLDRWLADQGYGLPIIGTHVDITAGGFASVGGFSASSHAHGAFVDTVEWLEYVDWDGEVVSCSPTERPEHFYRALTGLGRYGVITALTIRVLKVDKLNTIVETEQTLYRERDLERFLDDSCRYFLDSSDTLLAERGFWFDLVRGRVRLIGGQFCGYRPTRQSAYTRLRDRAAYGYLHGIGYLTGRFPAAGKLLMYAGMAGLFFSPKYGTMKNVELVGEKTLDTTIGDPTRMIAIILPVERYHALFRATYDLMRDFRACHGCFTFIAIYVKGIRSAYLAQGHPDRRFCELVYYLGIESRRMTPALLEDLVSQLDDLCIAHGAFRYLHTKTVKDPERRRRLDPNTYYAERAALTAVPAD